MDLEDAAGPATWAPLKPWPTPHDAFEIMVKVMALVSDLVLAAGVRSR